MHSASLSVALFGCIPALAADTSFNDIDHGRNLATVGDCTACHTSTKAAYRGRPPDRDAVRDHLFAQHYARSRNRHWGMVRR